MKKLFRTSKSTVDPLPPPPAQPQQQQQQQYHHAAGPMSPTIEPRSPHQHQQQQQPPNMKKSFQSLMMGGVGAGGNNNNDHHHQNHGPGPDHGHDRKGGWGFGGLGGEKVTPFPMDLGRNGGQQPPPPPSKKKDKGASKAPTLLDMQQGTDWRGTNGHYDSSTPTTANSSYPYLPPGARPPSPPPPIRPGTPTRYPYTNTPSQSSQTSMHHAGEDATPRMPGGRDRGYSSASEPDSVPMPKMHPVRSPLAFPDKPNNGHDARPPPPHQQQQQQQQSYAPPSMPPPQQYSAPPNHAAYRHEPDDGPRPEEPKEKKKFWGVAWGEKKDKDKDKDKERDRERQRANELARPPMEDKRPSFEGWREPTESVGHGSSGHHSASGHYSQGRHQAPQPQMHPVNQYEGYSIIDSAENVTQAIDMLVPFPDPPMSAIYAVCDRINQSQTPDSICKEAAKALRKHFKHGNEGERRATAKLWLIMMRNIGNESFRHYAASKKFVSPLETILLASPNKPVVSSSTHSLLKEVVADLTYMYGGDKNGEGLLDIWKKIKAPQDPERGSPLSPKHPLYAADELVRPPSHYSAPSSRRGSEPMIDARSRSPDQRFGPAYASLPNHSDDIRRLHEESIAAKESARVLTEALVYTRPEDLHSKPIIHEFYKKCFMAHESLTNQMDWAQAEASKSRESANVQRLMTTDHEQDVRSQTMEEEALAALFEAHSNLAEAIRQHDELERMAQDEQELRQVRERSRKETRMDRNELLAPQPGGARASGSRSPSPIPHARLPPPPQGEDLPGPRYPQDRSRTPSPDRFAPPKMSTSPGRAPSPLSKARGPRPLPNPTRSANGSNPAILTQADAASSEDDPNAPAQPSRKALGKRRAVVDHDNDFDPDDMFTGGNKTKESSASSEESLIADEVYTSKPVKYAYDAYQEKLDRQKADSERGSESSHAVPPAPAHRPGTEAFRA